MSSTILYKFRSGTTFEAIPLPGTAARLFDVKKAIVQAKKLDASAALEFDLSVRDATTNQEYTDESMLLPRGTRVIVQRLPAPKGHGFLARMARISAGLPGGTMMPPPSSSSSMMMMMSSNNTSSSLYTIDSRAHEEDEFVSASNNNANNNEAAEEEQELAALRAATDAAASSSAAGGGAVLGAALSAGFPRGPGGRGGLIAGSAGVVPGTQPPGSRQHHHQGGGGGGFNSNNPHAHGGGYRQRPNADPELREQEKLSQPKKRATGIPRTFLSLAAPSGDDGGEGGGAPLLQPNAIGFEELVTRRGGQSESAAGTSRDLDYALKVTATDVPEYLQCAICHGVVKNAMILPWDPEGRTTCESCIRDALNQSGFRCPLTGQEGVSPDDLLPNAGLRRAADTFVKGVFEKLREIEQQVDDEDEEPVPSGEGGGDSKDAIEGDGVEKGVLVTRRTSMTSRKNQDDDDPFGAGDADFGGDVFAISAKKAATEVPEAKADLPQVGATSETAVANSVAPIAPTPHPSEEVATPRSAEVEATGQIAKQDQSKPAGDAPAGPIDRSQLPSTPYNSDTRARSTSPTPSRSAEHQQPKVGSGPRRDAPRRRGPPIGYAMGPAGYGAIVGPPDTKDDHGRDGRSPRGDGRRDGRPGGYSEESSGGHRQGGGGHDDRAFREKDDRGGRRGGGRNGGRDDSRSGDFRNDRHGDKNRSTKRPRSDSDSHADDDTKGSSHRDRYSRDDYAPRGGGGRGGGGGRWEDRGHRGGGRGFRGGGSRHGYRGRH